MKLRFGLPLAAGLSVWLVLGAGQPHGHGPVAQDRESGRPPAADDAPEAGLTFERRPIGRSGELRTRLVLPGERLSLPVSGVSGGGAVWYRWIPVTAAWPIAVADDGGAAAGGPAGGEAASRPTGSAPLGPSSRARAPTRSGAYWVELGGDGWTRRIPDFTLIVQVPFERKRNGRLNGYRIGSYPAQVYQRTDRYGVPAGFIEVTPHNQHVRLSRHFRLGEFLTKDQHDVWPKYVVVDTLLLDKLELVMTELNASGVRAERMVVMSGFRTPQYNRLIGQGAMSRHQFGDAADVWVDNEGDGYMSDLNGDGRRDIEDARVILRAVERVEARHPDLLGGAGLYPARPGVRGPFIHVDVRGRRARW